MTKSLLSLLLALSAAAACGSDDDDDGGSPTPDASLPVGADAMPGGGIAYMQPCNVADDQCADGLLCFSFNNKGPHCTHGCDVDEDCESPTKGCGGMNVCSPP